jgi:hypothetical protein
LTGSAGCDDLFDAESYAIHCTPAEAVDWFRRNCYEIPADLRSDSGPPDDQAAGIKIIQNVETMMVQQLNQVNSNFGDVNNAIQSD